jgi:hypothetical protein
LLARWIDGHLAIEVEQCDRASVNRDLPVQKAGAGFAVQGRHRPDLAAGTGVLGRAVAATQPLISRMAMMSTPFGRLTCLHAGVTCGLRASAEILQ